MSGHQELLEKRLEDFRRKYYTDKMVRGALIVGALVLSMLFVALVSEGLFGFSAQVRTAIVFFLGLFSIGILAVRVVWPALQWMKLGKQLSDFQIAGMVRQFFPDINDKLINLLQLRRESEPNSLAWAAVERRAGEIAPVPLSSAINLKVNRKYVPYVLAPIVLLLLIFVIDRNFIAASSHRLLHYNEQFLPPPPFTLKIREVPGQLVAGDQYVLDIQVDGSKLPAELFLFLKSDAQSGGAFIDYPLDKTSPTTFTYTLKDLKTDFSFFVGNPDVRTESYTVDVIRRPSIHGFRLRLDYPAYTGLSPQYLDKNIGDARVLKGTRVTWELEPQGEVSSAQIVGLQAPSYSLAPSQGELYQASLRVMEPYSYFISLLSPENIRNADTVRYRIEVSPDRYPTLYIVNPSPEFNISGEPILPLDIEIGDDFGFSQAAFYYRRTKSGGAGSVMQDFETLALRFDPKVLLQPRSYQIDLRPLGFEEGDEFEYYVKVWDNDGVSGPKSAESGMYVVRYPSLEARYDEVESDQAEVERQLDALRKTATELQEAYQKMQEKLLEQKRLSFDDKKEMQRLMEDHQQMLEKIDEAQKQFEETKEKLQNNQMISESTLEKYENLNKLIEDLQNEEIEKLLEEIQKKLDNLNPEQFQEQMERLQNNNLDLKKNLERTLELLKQLEVQQKLDEIRNKVDNLQSKQELLNEQLERAQEAQEMKELSERQKNLEDKIEDIQQELKSLEEMKSQTDMPDEEQMKDLEADAEQAEQQMEDAASEMEQAGEQKEEGGRQNNKASQQSKQSASQKQKQAAQKLEEMSEQLSAMQSDMQSQQDQENLENLRSLLENLLKLSFDQEDLRDEVKKLNYGDPSLQEKSQRQKKLQDDMQLVRDSLESLASRVFQIQKFVLDESAKITSHMGKTQTFFRDKNKQEILFNQQSAMTSINNLANMLSDAMKQMQEQMMSAKQGQGMCTKPGMSQPSMQGLPQQQQQLNQQMQEMLDGGQMEGDKLRQMAAQQAAIRKQLEEARNKMQQEGGKSLGDLDKIMQDMKESEEDMQNRKLAEETMLRQRQILSRLLQADRSVRERELDDQRESRTAREFDRKSPDELSLEEYKNQIRQELLRTNKLEYSSDFIILIEQYFKKLEGANE